MRTKNRLIIITLFILILTLLSDAQAGLLNARYLKEQRAKKENYFKGPQNKLMIVIDQMENTDTSTFFESTMMILGDVGTSGAGSKKLTPFVVVLDFSKAVEQFLEGYTAASEKERQLMLPLIDAKLPVMSMVANSDTQNGLEIKVYFDGDLIASDSSSLEYPTLSVGFRLPMSATVKKLYEKQASSSVKP